MGMHVLTNVLKMPMTKHPVLKFYVWFSFSCLIKIRYLGEDEGPIFVKFKPPLCGYVLVMVFWCIWFFIWLSFHNSIATQTWEVFGYGGIG